MNRLSLSLPPVPTAGRIARAAVRDRFTGVLNRNTVADLELVISELVANSVEHGHGTIRLAVEHSVHEINGSVTDDGDGFDYAPSSLTSQAPRGRGLAIVEALVTRWGIRYGSTQVWFDITIIGSREQAQVPDCPVVAVRPRPLTIASKGIVDARHLITASTQALRRPRVEPLHNRSRQAAVARRRLVSAPRISTVTHARRLQRRVRCAVRMSATLRGGAARAGGRTAP